MISKIIGKKPYRDKESTNFCYYPFFQVLVTAAGNYRPCSKHMDDMTHNGEIITTKNATFNDAWNSTYMQEIRQSMLDNKQFPGCRECWRMQKMGLRPMRHDSFDYPIPHSQVENPVKPMRVEFNSSNVCNLKCRICSSAASTQWIKEAKELYNFHDEVRINLKEENLEQAKEWADNFIEIGLYGGEPLLSQENLDFLDYLIEKDLAKNIEILGNTNGTVWNEEIEERISHFKAVKLGFSMDDIGKRFEYQRKNAKWDEVVANMKRAYAFANTEKGKNYHPATNFSLSIFNIYYLPEYYEFFAREFPGWQMHWNLVYDPWYYSAQILPQEIKDIIQHRIATMIPEKSPLIIGQNKMTSELLQFLNWKEDHFNMDEFFRVINRHDVFREETYADVFPEFWALIKQYKPDDLTMGVYELADVIKIKSNEIEQNPLQFLAYNKLTKLRTEFLDNPNLEAMNTDDTNEAIIEGLRDIHNHLQQDNGFDDKLEVWAERLQRELADVLGFYHFFFALDPITQYLELAKMDPDDVVQEFEAALENTQKAQEVAEEIDPNMKDDLIPYDPEKYPRLTALVDLRNQWNNPADSAHLNNDFVNKTIINGLLEIDSVLGMDAEFQGKMRLWDKVLKSESIDQESFYKEFFNEHPTKKYHGIIKVAKSDVESEFIAWFAKDPENIA